MQSVSTQKDTGKGPTHFLKLLTPEETAEILGVKVDTLCYWRCTGRYHLPFVKSGRLVRYRPRDIQDFIERRLVEWEE